MARLFLLGYHRLILPILAYVLELFNSLCVLCAGHKKNSPTRRLLRRTTDKPASVTQTASLRQRDRIAYLSFMITKPSLLTIFTPISPTLYHLNNFKTYGFLLVETCWHRMGWPFLIRWRNSVPLHRQAYENIIAQKWRRG